LIAFVVDNKNHVPRRNLVPFLKDCFIHALVIDPSSIAAVQVLDSTSLGAAFDGEVLAGNSLIVRKYIFRRTLAPDANTRALVNKELASGIGSGPDFKPSPHRIEWTAPSSSPSCQGECQQ